MSDDAYLSGFLQRVASWMNSTGLQGRPMSLRAENSSWNGSTEEGFRDELRVVLTYEVDGVRREWGLDEAEQESLWRHVIPGPAQRPE